MLVKLEWRSAWGFLTLLNELDHSCGGVVVDGFISACCNVETDTLTSCHPLPASHRHTLRILHHAIQNRTFRKIIPLKDFGAACFFFFFEGWRKILEYLFLNAQQIQGRIEGQEKKEMHKQTIWHCGINWHCFPKGIILGRRSKPKMILSNYDNAVMLLANPVQAVQMLPRIIFSLHIQNFTFFIGVATLIFWSWIIELDTWSSALAHIL